MTGSPNVIVGQRTFVDFVLFSVETRFFCDLCQVPDRSPVSFLLNWVIRGGHMPGLRLIEGAAFDPETTRVMGVAYEQACVALDEDNVAVRESRGQADH
jgi:hypothetical protein